MKNLPRIEHISNFYSSPVFKFIRFIGRAFGTMGYHYKRSKVVLKRYLIFSLIVSARLISKIFQSKIHMRQDLDEMFSALTELRDVVLESDISPFEMNHSGLIKALLNYLTTTDAPGNRYDRLKMFWKLFAESTVNIVPKFRKSSCRLKQ